MSVSSKTISLTDRNNVPGLRYEDVDLTTTDYTPTGGVFRGFVVGTTGGAVVVQDAAGINHTFTALNAGTVYPLGGNKIIKTGTVATPLIAILD